MTAQTAPASNLEQNISALKNCLPYAFRQDVEGQHQLCWPGFDKAPLQEPFFARDVEARMFGPYPKFFPIRPYVTQLAKTLTNLMQLPEPGKFLKGDKS